MPFEALAFYLESKYQHENYVMDCLWSQATGFQFADTNEPKEVQKYSRWATLPRWYDYFKQSLPQDSEQLISEHELFTMLHG